MQRTSEEKKLKPEMALLLSQVSRTVSLKRRQQTYVHATQHMFAPALGGDENQ